MRLAWLTDIHLNFVGSSQRHKFLEYVKDAADAVAISGDIGESHEIVQYLLEINDVLQKPVYFVLGNHDFFRGSIVGTRQRVSDVTRQNKHLYYLSSTGVLELTPKTAIVGHDGWYDGRCGDYQGTKVVLNDHTLIAELARSYKYLYLDKYGLLATIRYLADEAACHFRRVLEEAVTKYEEIIAVTHVPPFRAAAWHEGKISDDDFLPYFACKVVGDVMKEVMAPHPQTNLLVLCGHTHGGGEVQITRNIRVLTGEAVYGKPVVQQVFDLE